MADAQNIADRQTLETLAALCAETTPSDIWSVFIDLGFVEAFDGWQFITTYAEPKAARPLESLGGSRKSNNSSVSSQPAALVPGQLINCWTCPGQLLGDASGDGLVNYEDFADLHRGWNTTNVDDDYNPCADFDHNNEVDNADLAAQAKNFTSSVGPCFEPGQGDCYLSNGTPGCDDATVQNCVCAIDPLCCQGVWDHQCVQLLEELGCGICEPGDNTCCTFNLTPGCQLPDVQDCVCQAEPSCCDVAGSWTSECVELVDTLGCGACATRTDCCQAHDAPGCEDPQIEECVCAQDAFCCTNVWDGLCIDLAEQSGCAICEPTLGKGDCCMANGTPGCVDLVIQDCVCALDDFCCTVEWDVSCVLQVNTGKCGLCEALPGDGDCCLANGTPGCQDPAIQQCVCAADPACCFDTWNDACVGAVDLLGCGVCPD